MKHLANIMQFNDYNTNQESTVGRIVQEGTGKKKRIYIKWIGDFVSHQPIDGNYYDACRIALNADNWNFIRPV